jgi:hypothetical protein
MNRENMNADKHTPRLLGAAFLIQALASAVSGLLLFEPMIVFLPNLPFELTMGVWFLVKGKGAGVS